MRQDNDWIFESLLQVIFTEYIENVMTYIDDDKQKRVIEIGRNKSHLQKKRAKEGLKILPVAEREVFVIGCYEELRIQLLRNLYRLLGDSADYKNAEKFLSEKIEEEKEAFKIWFKGVK